MLLDNFYNQKSTKDKLTIWCKNCIKTNSDKRYKNKRDQILTKNKIDRKNNPERFSISKRKAKLKHKYNLSIEQYNKMFIEQNGLCYLCNKHECILCVDHNHKTGEIRKLLCRTCNSALGGFHDDIFLLEKAINYLIIY